MSSLFGSRGLQGEGVQFAAHPAAQRGIDHLVLLHAGHAAELLGDDGRGVVVAVARQVFDGDVRVRAAPP